jgi:hypothetical protein
VAVALAEPQADTIPFGSPAKPRAPWVYDLETCDGCALVAERGHSPVCEPGPAVERRSRREQQRELRQWRKKIDPAGDRARLQLVDEQFVERQRRRQRVAEQARYRPGLVLAQTDHQEDEGLSDDTAVLRVPASASAAAKDVAKAAALIASDRLLVGDSLDFALGKLALGRDLVRRTLEQIFGISLSRNTVAAALQELRARSRDPSRPAWQLGRS